jgi:hypothetical protein
MKTTEDKDLRTLDIITHEVGVLEMEHGTSSAEERRWAESVVASMRARIAEYRRSRLPAHVPIKKAAPISERLLAMSRSALETLFVLLAEKLGPDVQVAHRKLETLSDNDLRRLIQTIESQTQKE